jgi:hypothetical protein
LVFYGKTPVLIVPWSGIGVVNEQL